MRERIVMSLPKLKKYVDEAIEKGCTEIRFEDTKFGENPYFLFEKLETMEESRLANIEKAKNEFSIRLQSLEKESYIDYSFRQKHGITGHEKEKIIEKFLEEKNIPKTDYSKGDLGRSYISYVKRICCDEYDDYEDNTETVFVSQIIRKTF